MKTQHTSSQFILILILCIGIFACSEDDPQLPGGGGNLIEGDGISEEAFDHYQGEIGFVLNARDVAKKGYVPIQAELQIDASSGDFSQIIDLDPVSYMGQIKFPVEDLDEAAVQELSSGVPVSVTIRDNNGIKIIAGQSLSSVSFLANPQPQNVNAVTLEETPESAAVNLKEGTDYFLQQVDADGMVMNKTMTHFITNGSLFLSGDENSFVGDQPNSTWNFVPVPVKLNTYYIHLASSNAPIVNYEFPIANINQPTVRNGARPGSAEEFTFEKENDGIYRIRNSRNELVRVNNNQLTYDRSGSQDVYWRVIAKDIDWIAQSIGTTLISPILPEAQTAFSFNSTLTNCGSGDLSQTVGADFSEQRINRVGWEESLSIGASITSSIEATAGIEFSAGFFGTGAKYNASVTLGFEVTAEATRESVISEAEEFSQMETYFSSRTITVPSGRASLVYDAYQFYDNVRVEYVQRFRLSALDEDGNSLSGEEIKSLMAFSRFTGVVNTIESESVVFTVKGSSVLDRFIETQSSVEDVPAACN